MTLKDIMLFTMVFFTILPTAVLPAFEIDQIYWNKAVEKMESSRCMVPQTILETEKIRDPKGKLKENNRTEYRIFQNPNKNLDVKLLSRTENKSDNTAAYRDEFAENKIMLLSVLDENRIFYQDMQKNITLTSLVVDKNTAHYTFDMMIENHLFKGEADIDIKTDGILFTRVSCKKIKQDGVTITDLIETIWYTAAHSCPEKIRKTMQIDAPGFFNSFKGSIEQITRLSDYFCHDKKLSR